MICMYIIYLYIIYIYIYIYIKLVGVFICVPMQKKPTTNKQAKG